MRALLLAVLMMALSLAGCSYDTGRPGDGGDDGGDGGDGGDGDGPPAEPEGDSGVFNIALESDGAATIEVPFPTLDSCRSAQDWMGAEPSVQGAVPELRTVSGEREGPVLALSARDTRSEWSVQIPLGPACQTLRYDPWTIDPDADNGTVEVRVTEGQVSFITVLVRRVRDGTGEAILFEGVPSGNGWTSLPEKTRLPI